MDGWMGKILRVDLNNLECKDEELDPGLARDYIGGRGIAVKILCDEIDPTIEPLSPENKLIFATGPSTGVALGGNRYFAVAKSPLTGTIGLSNAGGKFGAMMKHAGYDVIIFEGKAAQPVYLSICDNEVKLISARHLWGMTTHETEDLIREEIGDYWVARKTHIASIGPAGEKLSKMASIMNDKDRAAGRGGMGAVMGSKNLKAVVVRGNNTIKVANPEAHKETTISTIEMLKKNPITNQKNALFSLPGEGTSIMVQISHNLGMMPVKNFQGILFEHVEKINGPTMVAQVLRKKAGCYSCSVACDRRTQSSFAGVEDRGGGPEFETVSLFGADCLNSDLGAICLMSHLCNRLGMDTIEMAIGVSCAMELFEKGIISEKDLGFPLKWGDPEAMVKLIRQTGIREGFGDLMAEGGYRMAENFGHSDLYMGSKKMGFAAYDPRGMKGMGLEYATSNRGACHMRGATGPWEIREAGGPFTYEDKAPTLKFLQDATTVADMAGICMFHTRGAPWAQQAAVLCPLIETVTGVGYDADEVLRIGEKVWNMERLFNLEAGITKADDTLPPRMLNEPIAEGPAKGQVHELNIMMPEYYKARGWDVDGVPTPRKLEELGLN